MSQDTHCPSLDLLRRSLDPDEPLSDSERQRIEAHVDGCQKGCKQAIADLLRDTLRAGDLDATESAKGPVTPAAGTERLPSVPGYEILGVLGRGGMGIVYQARHIALRRTVALKMIRSGEQASAEDLARFAAEAQAVARLRHPNIVQIYEVGQHDGAPFFSLEFLGGGTLAQRLNKTPQPARVCSQTVEVLARAVHHAHTLGIVHRDLKPANVLLQVPESGEPVSETAETLLDVCNLQRAIPKITDFGLAKHLEEDLGHTQTGAVMGTPAYMAPEQAAGESKNAGPAVDVYALGVILYEMLTGRPPFTGNSTLDILEQVRHRDPERPSKLQPKTHRDLETICLKALEKEPQRRYLSALELAEDLARFNAGEPIKARPEGWASRWWRRVQRHRVAALVSLFLAVAFLAAGIWIWNWVHFNREINDLERSIQAAIDAPELNDAYVTRMEADLAALAELDPDKASDARQRFQQRYLRFQADQLLRQVDAAVDAPALSPDYWGRLQTALAQLNSLDSDAAGIVRGRFHKRFGRLLEERIRKVALAPDEIVNLAAWVEKLAAEDVALAAPLRTELQQRKAGWDPVTGLGNKGSDKLSFFEPGLVELQGDVVVPVAAVERSALILTKQKSSNHDEWTAVFDERWEDAAHVGLVLNSVRRHDLEINALIFSPDGKALASASGYRPYDAANRRWIGGVRVWELNGKERFSYRPGKAGALSLAYFPNNTALAVACDAEGIVRLLDPLTGKLVHQFVAHEGAGIGGLAVSRDGQTLATGSGIPGKSGEVRLWDTKTWQPRQTFGGFKTIVVRLALSADGRLLAAAGQDRSVKVWDLASRQEKLSGLPFFYETAGSTLSFSGDSKTLIAPFNYQEIAGANIGPFLLFWDTTTEKRKKVPIGMPASAVGALAGSDLHLAMASHWSGELMLMDLATGQNRLFQQTTLQNAFTSLAFSPDGNYLAVGTAEGAVQVRQVKGGRLLAAFENQGYTFSLRTEAGEATNPAADSFKKLRARNGNLIVALSRDGSVLREQSVLASEIPPGPVQLVARRDGHRLFFQVNALPPLEFEEAQPLPAQGALALIWPKGIGLKSLQAKRRQLPEGATPLERGDDLFARSMYTDALASYRDQIVAVGASDKEVGQEARLKAALCLLKLQRLTDALPELERLAGEGRSRWSALAGCELLQHYLNLRRHKDVDTLFDVLSVNHSLDTLTPLITKGFRESLLGLYTADVTEAQLMFVPRAADLRNLDRAAKIYNYFQVAKADRVPLRLSYLRGYQFNDKLDLALQTAEELLTDESSWAGKYHLGNRTAIVEKLAWILRQKGQAQLALTRVNQFLEKGTSGQSKQFQPLLLERARIHIALKQWDQAESDVEAVLRLDTRDLAYRQFASACLTHGFLRQRRGDSAGALKSWQAGLLSKHAAGPAQPEGESLQYLAAVDTFIGTAIASLAGALSPAEADALLEKLSVRRRGVDSEDLFPVRLPLPTGLLREMWRTPRGMACARKLAFQELSYSESLLLPIILAGTEIAHQGAMPRDLSPEQEAVLWTATERTYRAYLEEKLQVPQMIGLALTWKGTTNFLGWGGVASALQPSLRGPLAYVLGQRYLTRLQKPAEALTFFETAVRDSSSDSSLKKLAQAEVDRLKKTK